MEALSEETARREEVLAEFANLSSLEEQEEYIRKLEPGEVQYINEEDLLRIFEQTKKRDVCEACIASISKRTLDKYSEREDLSRKMLLKLTLSHSSHVVSQLMNKADFDAAIAKEIIRNNKEEFPVGLAERLVNHKVMNDDTLWEIVNGEPHNYILNRILVRKNVSRRIIEKLREHPDSEISEMAKARDPETSKKDLKNIVNRELRTCERTPIPDIDGRNGSFVGQKEYVVLTDVLEAAMSNPSLPEDSLNKIAEVATDAMSTDSIIPHPNIRESLLEKYVRHGTKEVKPDAEKRLKEIREGKNSDDKGER